MDIDIDPLPDALTSDIFDRGRIRQRRSIMAQRGGEAPFVATQIAEQVFDRLGVVKRSWRRALIIGAHTAMADRVMAQGVDITIAEPGYGDHPHIVYCDMDRVITAKGPFDLIMWPGGLEATNDVPGALAQCRALLLPDGLLIGALVGAGSLPALRRAVRAAEPAADIARFHPQIDIRAIGDVLQRTGFALPTVDIELLTLRYSGAASLIRDLRGSALTNSLTGPVRPFSRAAHRRLLADFGEHADADGRTEETLSIIHFVGWAPHPDQPQPAKRGSATASLSSALQSQKTP